MKQRAGVLLAVGLAALLVASSASGAWQYRGHVSDGHRTTFQAVVTHRDRVPRTLAYAATGRLHLKCNKGGVARKKVETDLALHIFEGHFGLDETGEEVGPGGPISQESSRISGTVTPDRVSGMLRLRTKTGNNLSRRCDSGVLHWHAHRVAHVQRSR